MASCWKSISLTTSHSELTGTEGARGFSCTCGRREEGGGERRREKEGGGEKRRVEEGGGERRREEERGGERRRKEERGGRLKESSGRTQKVAY